MLVNPTPRDGSGWTRCGKKTPGAAPSPVSTRSRRPEEQRQREDKMVNPTQQYGLALHAVERKTPRAAPSPVSTRSRRSEKQRHRDGKEKREQRGWGATCAHRPAGETKLNEDQKLCDGGDRSNQLVAPPRDISLDDTDEKREGPCHFQEQRPGTKLPRKGGNVTHRISTHQNFVKFSACRAPSHDRGMLAMLLTDRRAKKLEVH